MKLISIEKLALIVGHAASNPAYLTQARIIAKDCLDLTRTKHSEAPPIVLILAWFIDISSIFAAVTQIKSNIVPFRKRNTTNKQVK